MHFRILGRHIIVLNTAEAISDLLDKRNAATADRVMHPMLTLYGPLRHAHMPSLTFRRSLLTIFTRGNDLIRALQ